MIHIFDTGGRWFMACHRHSGLTARVDAGNANGTTIGTEVAVGSRVAFPLDEVEGYWEAGPFVVAGDTLAGRCVVNWINPGKDATVLVESFDEVIDAISAYDASKS